jgi:hypothetical protein
MRSARRHTCEIAASKTGSSAMSEGSRVASTLAGGRGLASATVLGYEWGSQGGMERGTYVRRRRYWEKAARCSQCLRLQRRRHGGRVHVCQQPVPYLSIFAIFVRTASYPAPLRRPHSSAQLVTIAFTHVRHDSAVAKYSDAVAATHQCLERQTAFSVI